MMSALLAAFLLLIVVVPADAMWLLLRQDAACTTASPCPIQAAANQLPAGWPTGAPFAVIQVPGDAGDPALFPQPPWVDPAVHGHSVSRSAWDGSAVVANPALSAPPEMPQAFRAAIPGIFSGTDQEKLDRMHAVVQKYPSVALAYSFLYQTRLSQTERAFVGRVAAEIKARIGTADEILAQAEYSALKSLADAYGLSALFP